MCNCHGRDFQQAKTYTHRDFINEWGIPPYKWGIVRAIAGCSTDNVRGIEGVGEKTAIKFIRGELKETSKIYQKIQENQEIIQRNISLVVLPFDNTNRIRLRRQGRFDTKKFIDCFNSFFFSTFIEGEMWLTCQKIFDLD